MNFFMFSRHSRWLLPIGALLTVSAALVLALLAHHWLATAMRHELAQQKAIRLTLDDAGKAVAPACAPEFNYAQSLPSSVSLDKLVQSLQDSSKALGVNVLSVSGEPHAAAASTLATLDVNIALHGAYPAVKSTLAESLSRFESGAVQSMRFKRAGATLPIAEDASVQIVFALRPQTFGPVDCRMPPIGSDAVRSK